MSEVTIAGEIACLHEGINSLTDSMHDMGVIIARMDERQRSIARHSDAMFRDLYQNGGIKVKVNLHDQQIEGILSAGDDHDDDSNKVTWEDIAMKFLLPAVGIGTLVNLLMNLPMK